MVTCQGSTRLELPWGLLALCRRTLGSERHREAIAWPDKLGTAPMAYGGLKKEMDATVELGRNSVSKHQFSLIGGEQADAGRDCRTSIARPNSQARTRTGKKKNSLFSWPLLYVMAKHTYLNAQSATTIVNTSYEMATVYIQIHAKLCLLLTCCYDNVIQVFFGRMRLPVAPVAQRYLVTLWHVGTRVRSRQTGFFSLKKKKKKKCPTGGERLNR